MGEGERSYVKNNSYEHKMILVKYHTKKNQEFKKMVFD